MLWALMHPHITQMLRISPFAGNSLEGLFHSWHREPDICSSHINKLKCALV